MERGHLGHADRLHTEEVHVPLILKAEGKKGDVNIPVSLVDVYPTLLQLAGVKSDNKIHGYSLLTQLDKRKEKGVLMEVVRHYNQKAYVNSSGTKLLLDYKMDLGLVHDNIDQPMKETLYDIYQDKYEVSPLKDEELLEKVRAEYIQYYSEILELSRYYNKSEIEMDQETFENLKTLGYL